MSLYSSEKEKYSEDYCFVCKDGGTLRLCDHKECTKSYHPECVDKDPTFLDADEIWTCGRHSCCKCKRSSTFKCFCCPTSFCRKCVRKADYGRVKGTKGFCGECLKLAKLVEEGADHDSDGEKVDFDDRETWEFLWKDYWPIVKEEEGLSLEHVQYADAVLNGFEKCRELSDSDETHENVLEVSESEDDCDDEHIPLMTLKRKKDRRTFRKKLKPSKNGFMGWASVELFEFLSSLSKDTKDPLEKYDVYEIVREYIVSNNLLRHDKRSRKYVFCDSTLFSLLRRRNFKFSRLYGLLERHFTSSDSSDDELSCAEGESFEKSRKKLRMTRSDYKIKSNRDYHNELVTEPPQSCFVAITESNIKALYLKRSLIAEMIGDPDTFEGKIVGCFVRVKLEPRDYYGVPSKLYQLGQVTGVKKVPEEYKLREMSTDVALCISNMDKDVKISMLSDDDFEEEECKDLRQLAELGLFKRPYIVELRKKIRDVHVDIVKHSVRKELLKLDKLIERANEKGWRKDLYEYIDRKALLSKPEEVKRLIEDLPKITPEMSVIDVDSKSIYCGGESRSALPSLPTHPENEIGNKVLQGAVAGLTEETPECLSFSDEDSSEKKVTNMKESEEIALSRLNRFKLRNEKEMFLRLRC
ncbi:Zinc finger CCCH domain-containing protein 44 [Apostasia shenzhenica]|uniref:Zinc finger CCCH domain-containing protein 44 n=1 Tax=Apostasia shenzhenica TaxID=1088818 RepID=A0A2I0B1I3_9ASPA|nr:Zinc finger CCCH domain-containing protein 44 [Apostasia shenzhenica]